MSLEYVDLHIADEYEICAVIDDATDNGKTIAFIDSNDLDNPDKPLAVLLPWDVWEKITAAAEQAKS